MFKDFKKVMTQEFEMTDIGIMAYYLGIEVKQMKDEIFIHQEGYAKEILKKFKMEDCKLVNTSIEVGIKSSRDKDGKIVDPTFFKSLVGSLRYLTCRGPNILFAIGLGSQFMERLTITHFKAAKRILHYIKGTLDFGLFYSFSNDFKLVGYCASNWAEDLDDRISTSGYYYYFFYGKYCFYMVFK
ncbi:uncharacterized mitochondrial protein AtMg00810-like [Cornus florida]|uniref:uncharacterized mitochondrial protein AtMg00810-like n=1 Tax=Cornus florida TaxID=4283 RepID=UPI00289AAF1A|nr:uncharacterized mitochondrial protein AtMg00810-like [Cornus florida]